ncbi:MULTISPECIES: RHS repeat-associated core domain-containing protein [Pseudomonas]|uniref:RHS repeat-associated core domain-containing protein n=1 Tax=Pseudomonas quercus TaxID=2722792 RepID=A0ABX0YLS3_9PSED|nr:MULTISPECIES: RHS repeat-associated core domain-containing protein [Pseudomonas]MBF7144334.1 RHS repeat-associated core domain-containing protein [Pseudomonas sp. LY10J]NJP02873.1 RHS repeat-associated core domain-containing protein [Pseudomonas quercus]
MSLLRLDSLDNVLSSSPGAINRKRYTPFGVVTPITGSGSGFHGQLSERVFEGYLLGNGYRLYSPSLMRFLKADEHSPFGKGGINAHAFCGGDPVNQQDLTGRASISKILARIFKKPPLKFKPKEYPVEINIPGRTKPLIIMNKESAKSLFEKQARRTAEAYDAIPPSGLNEALYFSDQARALRNISMGLNVSKKHFEHITAKVGLHDTETLKEIIRDIRR